MVFLNKEKQSFCEQLVRIKTQVNYKNWGGPIVLIYTKKL